MTTIELVQGPTSTARADEGFPRLKRNRDRNCRVDGSTSPEQAIDAIARPVLDAVAVLLWTRTGPEVEVQTLRGLGPAAFFRGQVTVLPEPEDLLLEELAAEVPRTGGDGTCEVSHAGSPRRLLTPAGLAARGGPYWPA